MEHGGQANASTRERHTDYFFELPTAAVDAGLARLCDMLAAPTLDLRQQHAEREVLHAEYLAWSRDDLSAASRALAEAVPARHPLARCHAGERASLALQQEGFQQALRRFHRDFYHAGQARLVLLGPQPPEQLRELAEREGNRLRAATPTPRPPPPALLPPRHSRVAMARPGLCLLFTLQQLPDGAAPALQWLCQQLQHDAPRRLGRQPGRTRPGRSGTGEPGLPPPGSGTAATRPGQHRRGRRNRGARAAVGGLAEFGKNRTLRFSGHP
ncbi:hypothetical protein L1887_47387 [Cichorium endivia]|nr:hypothetical protein L1887_47387 [Cichorium endivia]